MKFLRNLLGIGTDITHYTVRSEKIPSAFDGFRILHLSDFHNGSEKKIYSVLEKNHFDAVFITGDMTDDDKDDENFFKLLSFLLKKKPVYIIPGNHDSRRPDSKNLYKRLSDTDAVFLCNNSSIIEKNGAQITVHGINDPGRAVKDSLNNQLKASLSSLKRRDGYEILLFHRANKLDLLNGMGFDLVLSGHMHGGHIRIPFLGGLFSPLSSIRDHGRFLFPAYTNGLYKKEDSLYIVNRGMSNPMKIPRFFNSPEIVIITLESQTAYNSSQNCTKLCKNS